MGSKKDLGSKINLRSKKNSGRKFFLVQTNFIAQNNLKKIGSKKCWSKKFWIKNLKVQKIFGSKNFRSKNFWVQKNCGSKKIVGPKINLGPKNCGSKKFESEKYFESKILAPPPSSYGIGLSMVGWIGGSIPLL